MADHTKIEWTDATWNPIRGCSMARGSETGGCLNCYAAREAVRYTGEGMPYEGLARMTANGPRWTGRIRVLDDPDHLLHPLRWQRPRLVFVNSMSDLFHESLPFAAVDKIVGVMSLAAQHTFQVLTKRPERMAEYLSTPGRSDTVARAMLQVTGGQVMMDRWPLPNVWWGVSAENQQTLDDRMPHVIRAMPNMKVAWLSAEPLLGPLDLTRWLPHERETSQTRSEWYPGLDWVVAGGESGPNARPANPAWFRTIRDQCAARGVPFLFKQWGEWAPVVWHARHEVGGVRDLYRTQAGDVVALKPPLIEGATVVHFPPKPGENWRQAGGNVGKVGKKAAGRLLDGVVHDGYPAVAGKGRS